LRKIDKGGEVIFDGKARRFWKRVLSNIGKKIREQRILKGMTQEEVAEKSEVLKKSKP
jgi:hypothetical protein